MYEKFGEEDHLIARPELDNGGYRFPSSVKANSRCRPLSIIIFSLVLLSSLGLNVLLSLRLRLSKKTWTNRSNYSGLSYDTTIVYRTQTDWWGENETLADELWDSLDTSFPSVAISDALAMQYGLPKAARFPWDTEKGLYVIKAVHQLHCLKLLRASVAEYDRTKKFSLPAEHLFHCLDGLRQDIMCIADDTLMPTPNINHHIGDGQTLQCRDWNKLRDWARAPEQSACFNPINEYRTIKNSLENFAFCPEDSQYYEVMNAYFAKHGHKDPFEK